MFIKNTTDSNIETDTNIFLIAFRYSV